MSGPGVTIRDDRQRRDNDLHRGRREAIYGQSLGGLGFHQVVRIGLAEPYQLNAKKERRRSDWTHPACVRVPASETDLCAKLYAPTIDSGEGGIRLPVPVGVIESVSE